MTSRYATMLLTREMFCGAALATLIGLGLGAWMTPTLQPHDPDPYANFALNPPTEPAGGYVAGASAASWPSYQAPAEPVTPAMWRLEPPPAEDAQPATDPNPALVQRIDWQGHPDAAAPATKAPAAPDPSAQGRQQDTEGRDGAPGPLQQ